MRFLKQTIGLFAAVAVSSILLMGCEEAELYSLNNPDWMQDQIDSIANSGTTSSTVELEGMNEDVYTVGETDYSSGWWTAFSKYYQIDKGEKFNCVFNLSISSSDQVYYHNFAMVVTNDYDRGDSNYKEFGAIRFDLTSDTASYNSQWGSDYWLFPFKYASSNSLQDPSADETGVQNLAGQVTVTVDRSEEGRFYVEFTNGSVTRTYDQPYEIGNLNEDESNTNIRVFFAPEGTYLSFLQANIEPIGGYTSAEDKEPVSMVLNDVPATVTAGTDLAEAMADVTATVTFEQDVTSTVSFSDLTVSDIDMDVPGEKTLIAVYNKTSNGNTAESPVIATATFTVVTEIASLEVTGAPLYDTYKIYTSAKTDGMFDEDYGLPFVSTNMEVTATYSDGATGVVDLANLTFGTVTPVAGTQNVKISASNGVSVNYPVTVKEVTATDVTPSPTTLGETDKSTAWWGAHFDSDILVASGETAAFHFTNYAGGSNWNNFVVVLRASDASEYAVLRSDNYGWGGSGYATNARWAISGGQADWATWLAAMDEAEVAVYVDNVGDGTCDVTAVMWGTDGNVYYQYYYGVDVTADDLNVDFTVDSCYLVFD